MRCSLILILATLTESMNNALYKSLVICGPSGVGKGTLIGKLLSSYPDSFGLSVSYTSRQPRQGEVADIHYHFVKKDFLINDIAFGRFKYIEHAEVHSNLYGTREDDVAAIHNVGKVCILDVDTKGVMQIKNNQFHAKYIFVAPSSLKILENRLRSRGTEKEEQIQKRLNNAKAELDYGLSSGNFDEVLINDNLEDTYISLVSHVKKWFPQAFLNT